MSENLTPCPFCGESEVAFHPRDLARWGCELPHQGSDAQYAHCDACGAEGPQSFHEHEAIEAWNRRASLPTKADVTDTRGAVSTDPHLVTLDKPAQVGSTIFREGVSVSVVIDAAQRNFEQMQRASPATIIVTTDGGLRYPDGSPVAISTNTETAP